MHLIRNNVLHGFEAFLSAHGVPARRVLAPNALTVAWLRSRDDGGVLTLETFERLLQTAERLMNEPASTLFALNQEPIDVLGMLGLAMTQSATVGEAIRLLGQSFSMQATQVQLHLDQTATTAQMRLHIEDRQGLPPIHCAVEYCMAASIPLLSALTGRSFRPLRVQFAHRPRWPLSRYRQLLRGPVEFTQLTDAIQFDASLLSQSIPTADPRVHQLLQQYLQRLQREHDTDLVGVTRSMIRHALHTGRCDAELIAALLGIHRRTLHRRLRSHGTSFSALVSATRVALAQTYLRDTDLPVTTIALTLGYADASAFTRAFRRERGVAPSIWRQQARQASSPGT